MWAIAGGSAGSAPAAVASAGSGAPFTVGGAAGAGAGLGAGRAAAPPHAAPRSDRMARRQGNLMGHPEPGGGRRLRDEARGTATGPRAGTPGYRGSLRGR